MTTKCLLRLTVPPSLEALVTDLMLERYPDRGFTTHKASGHGVSEAAMSTAERIAGYVKRVLVDIHCPDEAAARDVLSAVSETFPGADVHYSLTPILDEGHLTDERRA